MSPPGNGVFAVEKRDAPQMRQDEGRAVQIRLGQYLVLRQAVDDRSRAAFEEPAGRFDVVHFVQAGFGQRSFGKCGIAKAIRRPDCAISEQATDERHR